MLVVLKFLLLEPCSMVVSEKGKLSIIAKILAQQQKNVRRWVIYNRRSIVNVSIWSIA